jgi:hypothetical protein
MRFQAIVSGAALLCLCAACESAPRKNAFDQGPDQTKPLPKTTEAPAPEGPPDFEIDTIGAKVGFERAMSETSEGLEKLRADLTKQKTYVEGKDIVLRVDRQAKRAWVVTYLSELFKAGVGSVKLKTESREGYPTELQFLAQAKATSAPKCSAVGMILDDRSTAVWKLSGGTASRRQKGMAGPDLSMTGETLERIGKQCKDSDLFFVSGAESVEWGLIYDLAASSQRLEKFRFERMVLLDAIPTPGHKVDL